MHNQHTSEQKMAWEGRFEALPSGEVKDFGDEHPFTAGVYNEIARCYQALRDNKKALEFYQKAVFSSTSKGGNLYGFNQGLGSDRRKTTCFN